MLRDRPSDVVVVGAGIVGAACAYYAARAGLSVTLIERSTVGSGTTSRGGRQHSRIRQSTRPRARPRALVAPALAGDWGRSASTGLSWRKRVDLSSATNAVEPLHRFAAAQEAAGVMAVRVPSDGLRDLEPHLADDLPGGVHYQQDMQVQPVLAAAALVQAAREHTTRVVYDAEVSGIERDASGAVTAVRVRDRRFPTRAVVNAAGTWGGEVSKNSARQCPSCHGRGTCSSPSRCLVSCGTRSTPPTMSTTSPARGLNSRPPPWWKTPVAAPYSSVPAANASASTPACR